MSDYLDYISKLMPEPGDFRPVFAFSVHKAGSTLMHTMIAQVCRASKIPAISIPDRMFIEGYADTWQADDRMKALFGWGRVYFGFRNLPGFMTKPDFELSRKRAVLLVRDPRDALVSQYFSLGGKYVSHNLPKKNKQAFLDRLHKTAHLDIDEYTLQVASGYLKKLGLYRDHLNSDQLLLERYEEIYFDKQSFLQRIFDHFELEVSQTIITKVASDNDIRPEQEDLSKHIRKGLPGDHREKLRPETIEILNKKFRAIGQHFGYEL